MKILLITPCIEKYLLQPGEKSKEVKMFRFSMLSVLTVAACTPEHHDIHIVDEHIEAVDLDEDADVVGISFMTAHAPRAYELGDEFKKRGKTVVFGGYHPTFMAGEALRHCDAVVQGEAEYSWPRALADIENNRLQRIYNPQKSVDLCTLNNPPRHLLDKRGYITINAVQVTRGCENSCEFCSVSTFYGNEQRFRPVAQVVEEMESIASSFVLFIDDNIIGDEDYAKRLFSALIPLRKKWVSQASLRIAENHELVELAARSGCCGLFVGLESINSDSLEEAKKGFNETDRYLESMRKLQGAGIGIETGLMFGFDHDEVSIFQRTMDFLLEANIDAVQVSILTPLPGTALYKKMMKQRRIIDHKWENYDYRHVVFQPSKMTPEQLQNGVDWMIGEFYSPKNIAKRVFLNFLKPNIYRNLFLTLPVNLAYRRDARRWHIRGAVPTGGTYYKMASSIFEVRVSRTSCDKAETIVSEKGQITIPKAVRDKPGIVAGTVLEVGSVGGKLVAVKKEPVHDAYAIQKWQSASRGKVTDDLEGMSRKCSLCLTVKKRLASSCWTADPFRSALPGKRHAGGKAL